MKKSRSAFIVVSLIWGCTNNSPQHEPTVEVNSINDVPRGGVDVQSAHFAMVIDATGMPKCELVADDPTCNSEGPTTLMKVGPDGCCRLYYSDEYCGYPGLEGGPVSCNYTSCTTDGECDTFNTDPDNLSGTCVYTQNSFSSDIPGSCHFAWATCEVLADTPCAAVGLVYCSNGECTCTANADMSAATGELCDGIDNDCDGEVDENFSLGQACDGVDADLCENGTYTCAENGLSNECSEAENSNVVEMCDGTDNDCDGETDEDFPTLSVACDGNDADLCENGTYVCTPDGSGVSCQETGTSLTEVCNNIDDDCDGDVDEGCDDDEDGVCDAGMSVEAGSVCQGGDCDDEDAGVSPLAQELCNGKDDNCDGQTDEGFGLGDACTAGTGICEGTGFYSSCSENGQMAVCDAQPTPDASTAEACNNLDDDCDGQVDEGCDDDNDGWCDTLMSVNQFATCEAGDCDDEDTNVNLDAADFCNGLDDNCNGLVDEGCDDDEDGWCDVNIFVVTGATCQAGDCDDENASVHPYQQELCSTSFDDNCDGDTEFQSDGVTPACDSCANAIELECGEDVVINMATEPNAANSIENYACWTNAGAKQLTTVFAAPEVVVVPNAVSGTLFSLQIKSPGTGTVAFRLHGSCEPDTGSEVTPFAEESDFIGTCASYGASSVSGGVVGEDWIALDAATSKQVTVKFTCIQPAE